MDEQERGRMVVGGKGESKMYDGIGRGVGGGGDGG